MYDKIIIRRRVTFVSGPTARTPSGCVRGRLVFSLSQLRDRRSQKGKKRPRWCRRSKTAPPLCPQHCRLQSLHGRPGFHGIRLSYTVLNFCEKHDQANSHKNGGQNDQNLQILLADAPQQSAPCGPPEVTKEEILSLAILIQGALVHSQALTRHQLDVLLHHQLRDQDSHDRRPEIPRVGMHIFVSL